jgi:hypothetical protein
MPVPYSTVVLYRLIAQQIVTDNSLNYTLDIIINFAEIILGLLRYFWDAARVM